MFAYNSVKLLGYVFYRVERHCCHVTMFTLGRLSRRFSSAQDVMAHFIIAFMELDHIWGKKPCTITGHCFRVQIQSGGYSASADNWWRNQCRFERKLNAAPACLLRWFFCFDVSVIDADRSFSTDEFRAWTILTFVMFFPLLAQSSLFDEMMKFNCFFLSSLFGWSVIVFSFRRFPPERCCDSVPHLVDDTLRPYRTDESEVQSLRQFR